jgi:soluble lytic murein transglycosylase-like protein
MNIWWTTLWQAPSPPGTAVPARIAPFPDAVPSAPSSPSAVPATTASGSTFAQAYAAASQATGVPVALLEAVGTTESADDPTAVSVTGAEGVMQLEPATAAAEGVTDPWNPTENILGGAEYLAQQLATFHGNLSDAIAAYNAGPGAVEAYGGIPPYAQTQAYVTTVLGHYTANLTAEGATSL